MRMTRELGGMCISRGRKIGRRAGGGEDEEEDEKEQERRGKEEDEQEQNLQCLPQGCADMVTRTEALPCTRIDMTVRQIGQVVVYHNIRNQKHST